MLFIFVMQKYAYSHLNKRELCTLIFFYNAAHNFYTKHYYIPLYIFCPVIVFTSLNQIVLYIAECTFYNYLQHSLGLTSENSIFFKPSPASRSSGVFGGWITPQQLSGQCGGQWNEVCQALLTPLCVMDHRQTEEKHQGLDCSTPSVPSVSLFTSQKIRQHSQGLPAQPKTIKNLFSTGTFSSILQYRGLVWLREIRKI